MKLGPPPEGAWYCIDFKNRDCGVFIGPDGPTEVIRHGDVPERRLRACLSRIYPDVQRSAWRFGAWTNENCEPGTTKTELAIDPAGVIGEAK